MLSLLLEKDLSEEDNLEDEEEEEEEAEEEEAGPDEETILLTEEITECFALFDKNKTGFFDSKYLVKALKGLNIFMTDLEIEYLRESLSKDGMVSFENFYNFAFDKLATSDPYEILKLDFQALDPDKEGILPKDRFKKWMTTLGDPLAEKEAKELIKLGDPGNSGYIGYNELIAILTKK